jgi:hypothetical protein
VNWKKWTRTAIPMLALSLPVAAQNKILIPTNVASPNSKIAGVAPANILSAELTEAIVAQGSWKLENPDPTPADGTGDFGLTSYYGYDNDVVFTAPGGTAARMVPAAGALPSASVKIEATKTEPDKNTYLILNALDGADPRYNYGTHFLFQGHEAGVSGQGYITRINLDADGAHRITLLATKDVNGVRLPAFDGSTWYPFSERLLFTAELGANGGVWQATPGYPSQVEFLPALGRGGYEGIQSDDHGTLIIVEDVGGGGGPTTPQARRPNSFVYRFIPYNPLDLKQGGKLQALQLMSLNHPGPIVFGSTATPADADAAILSQDQKDLHTYGNVFQTNWVTIHDSATDPNAFDANALAKAANATPFKRPENGQFRPGSGFTEFVFDATGDTNIHTQAGTTYGGFGAIFRLKLTGANSGELRLVYRSDAAHSGLDNCGFWSADHIVFVEDAGDGLHDQRNALDSAYLFDLNADYSNPLNQPVRILAQGRDASATLDSSFSGMTGFQNEADNEITGFHISNGDPTVRGLLGATVPSPFNEGWRVFYTQQHGDNNTFEILPAK